MARVSAPLTISEEDRVTLEQMAHSGNDQLEIRAQIVLACSGMQQNKEIASELKVAVSSVAKWKEAYRSQGINGLQIIHAGGRPPKVDIENGNLIQHIQNYMEMHEGCSVGEIADAFHIPESKIRYELRKNGISLQRARRWDYLSVDQMSTWNPPVLGVYWSYAGGVILAANKQQTIHEGNILVGCLETRISSLSEELEKSVFPVTLTGLIATAAAFMNNTASGNGLSAEDFIIRTIDDFQGESKTEYHIFSFGKNPLYHGDKFSFCRTHHFDTMTEMTDSFLHWIGSLTTGTQHILAEKLIYELEKYNTTVIKDADPFVWYLKEVPEGESVIHFPADDTEGTIPVDGSTWSSVEELLNGILPKQEDSQNYTEVGVIQYQRYEDGTIACRHTRSKQRFTNLKDFDFSDRTGFEKSLSKFEKDNLLFAEEVAHANTDLYLDTVKKNLT